MSLQTTVISELFLPVASYASLKKGGCCSCNNLRDHHRGGGLCATQKSLRVEKFWINATYRERKVRQVPFRSQPGREPTRAILHACVSERTFWGARRRLA